MHKNVDLKDAQIRRANMEIKNWGDFRYDVFISYSHEADAQLAPALQKALQFFAKPWYRRRAIRIFRDSTNLAATPHLWSSIVAALEKSAYFILFASPKAAESDWVKQEIRYWIENQPTLTRKLSSGEIVQLTPAQRILIVLTDGEISLGSLNKEKADLDDNEKASIRLTGSAIPDTMMEIFAEEPKYVDLREVKKTGGYGRSDPEFMEAVALLSAPIRGIELDDLIGEDHHQYIKTKRLAWGAIATLTVLFLVAIGAAGVAQRNLIEAEAARKEAVYQMDIAFSGQLAADADLANRENRPLKSLFKAVLGIAYTKPYKKVILRSHRSLLSSVSALSGQPFYGELPVFSLSLSSNGQWLAAGTGTDLHGGHLVLCDLNNSSPGKPVAEMGALQAPINEIRHSPDGKWIAATDVDGRILLCHLKEDHSIMGSWVVSDMEAVESVTIKFCPNSNWFLAAGKYDADRDATQILVWDLRTGKPSDRPVMVESRIDSANVVDFTSDARSLILTRTGDILRGGGHKVEQWPWETIIQQRKQAYPKLLVERMEEIRNFSICHEGKSIFVASDDEARLIKFHANQVLWEKSFEIRGSAISADGRWVALIKPDGVTVLDLRQSDPEVTALNRECVKNVDGLVADPSGKLLAINSLQNNQWMTHIFDLSEADEDPFSIPKHLREIRFSPDGKWFIGIDDDDNIHLRDTANLENRGFQLDGHDGPVFKIAVTPDSHSLLSGGADGFIRRWNLSDGDPRSSKSLVLPLEKIKHFATDNSGRWVAAVNKKPLFSSQKVYNRILLWDRKNGHQQAITIVTGKSRNEYIRKLAISPRGKWLVVKVDDRFKVMPLSGGLSSNFIEIPVNDRKFKIRRLFFAGDDHLVASDRKGALAAWNLQTNDQSEPAWQMAHHQKRSYGAAASPDGNWIALAGREPALIVIPLKKGVPQDPIELAGVDKSADEPTFDPNSRYLAVSSQGKIIAWDLQTLSNSRLPIWTGTQKNENTPIIDLAIDSQARFIAGATRFGSARLWPFVNAQETTASANDPQLLPVDRREVALEFTQNGRYLITAAKSKAVVWDLSSETGMAEALPINGLRPDIRYVKIADGGDTALFAGDSNIIDVRSISVDGLLNDAKNLLGDKLFNEIMAKSEI